MSVRLETRGLSKKFGSFAAVANVSVCFEPGLIHAVLGENGAGKSTLMKLLFGLHEPSSGEILLDGRVVDFRTSMDAIRAGLGMVQQHFTLVDQLSAIDNIMLGAEITRFGRLNHQAAISRLEKLLPSQSLSVPWRTLVGDLSVGQKQRIEILKLLFRESQILFLDEPTAVLTPHEIEDFFEILRELKAQGRTLILITHKISEVLAICDTYTILRQGKLVGSGSVAEISGPEIVEKMIGRKLEAFPESVSVPGELLVEARGVQGLTVKRGSLKGVDLQVRSGEIVGIAGVDGSGQGQLIDCILGLQGFRGELEVFGQAVRPGEIADIRQRGVGLVPEDRHLQGLWLEESCFMNMAIGLEDRFVKFDVIQFDRLKHETANWARVFDVRSPSLEVAVGDLSGGNQQKLIFAREVVGRKPKLLLCHQPTRGVDLGAIDLIHRKLVELKENGLGVLMVSSELDELFKLCDRIYVFYEGRVAAEFRRVEFDRMRVGAAMTTVPVSDSDRNTIGIVHA